MNKIPIWDCSRCTYKNIERNAYCEMCDSPYNYQDYNQQNDNSYTKFNFNTDDGIITDNYTKQPPTTHQTPTINNLPPKLQTKQNEINLAIVRAFSSVGNNG